MKWIFLLLMALNTAFSAQAYICYAKTGGRFGDNLLNYLHAMWLSEKHKIPLLYTPFPYSEELMLDEGIQLDFSSYYRLRKMVVRERTPFDPNLPFLYESPYFPAFKEEQIDGKWWAFDVDWQNPDFRSKALAMIAPKKNLSIAKPPEGAVSIAIHIREGGGFDTDHTRLYDPLKLPPLPYYIEALSRAIALFPEQKIYCHLFTDAVDAEAMARKLRETIPPTVILAVREEKNHHTLNVLEDFFSLFEFDVLIRSRSNFSIVPTLLHDYAAVYFPAEYVRTGTNIDITRIDVEMNEPLYRRLVK